MTAALECFSGSPIDGDDAINQLFLKNCHRYDALLPARRHYSSAYTTSAAQPSKKWHRLSRNIAGAIAGFKNSFSLDPCPPSRGIVQLFPGNHLPEKLLRDIRRHLDLLPNSYSQSGFDIMDVVLHLRLVDQAADDDHPAVDIQQISGEPSVFKLTFACKSAFSLQAMYGAIEGSVLCCKKIQVFEKSGLALGVVTVAVDPGGEKHFKSRIAAELRSAAKKQRSSGVNRNSSLCHCLEEASLAVSAHTVGSGREELGRWILSAGDMEFVERAGINSFIGSYKGKKVWIKKLRGRERGNANEIEIRPDLARLMSCGKKNLLQFCGVCVDERNGICVVTPLMEGGSVRDLIRRRKKVGMGDVMRIGLQMAEGLLFVNSHGVSFRDLNSQRILLDGRGNACLGDMGIVSACRNPWEATEYETGGYQWLAPEIIAIDPESKSETWMSNVYSFGMVLWEMVAGEAAYSSYSPVQAAVGIAACGLRPEIPKDCPAVLRSLMIRCWNDRPSKRPQLSEIVDILKKQTNCFNYAG
ncbi:Serine/threonine-protein kinase HT1 [Platanthera zijinensis]|uniref:Serine/threonine-protein kinase HT1 n=1 Tax=Platanthera zijinensis TaxID=2320716 RepID=A0AAP0B4G0_9ASPA